MQIKNVAISVAVVPAPILAACVPAGPVLGLGPALDPFVGPVLVVALVGLNTPARSGACVVA